MVRIMCGGPVYTTLCVILRRIRGCTAGWLTLAVAVAACIPDAADAQNIQTYFPSGNGGYDQEIGVTVLSRARPLYTSPGIRVGSFVISPAIDESLDYSSDVNGNSGSGGWASHTSGSVAVGSEWDRNSIAATAGLTRNQYLGLPQDSYTDWNIGLGGSYTIGRGGLVAEYAHQTAHIIGSSIGAINTTTPALAQVDSGQLAYRFSLGDLTVTPSVSFGAYRFGPATVSGQTVDQDFLDRNKVVGEVVGRYSMSGEGSLLVVMRAGNVTYLHPMAGQPSNNAQDYQLLSGIDYQGEGVWRYRLLAGVEVGVFQAAQYPTSVVPIAEASVIWTPTGLTTVTGSLSREIGAPATSGTNGAIYTRASLVADHELLPNLFVQARGSIAYLQYLQNGGGTQTEESVGGGVTWLVNQYARVSLSYDFTRQNGNSSTAISSALSTQTTGSFMQHVVALTLHFGL